MAQEVLVPKIFGFEAITDGCSVAHLFVGAESRQLTASVPLCALSLLVPRGGSSGVGNRSQINERLTQNTQ